jgi:hypothetical protein
MATDELAAKLQKQMTRCTADDCDLENTQPSMRVFNPYTEYKEFTRKDIQNLEKAFKKYDVNQDRKLDLDELKVMMEKLHAPQTHLGLKDMIKTVDDDQDNKINFKEFLMIFRKAKNGELKQDSGLQQLYDQVMEIDVAEAGVKGAKSFFEAQALKQSSSNNFEREIREEQEEKRRLEDLRKKKREEFMAKKSLFG